MSDWTSYELDDIVWDDCAPEIDRHKKPRLETVCTFTKNTKSKYIADDGILEKLETISPTLKQGKHSMLEKGSWSCTPDGVFSASCDTDSIKEVATLTSDNTEIPNSCFNNCNVDSIGNEFSADDAMLDSRSSGMDNSLCHFPLHDISSAGSDLEFFSNEQEDRENGDLLYYGWPDIGNFEDVVRMFRSCDSTFGQGNASNDDEMSWFSSSSRAIDGPEDPLKKSGFKSSCSESSELRSTSKHRQPDMKISPDTVSPLVTDSDNSDICRTSSQAMDAVEAVTLEDSSYTDWLDTDTENRDETLSKREVAITPTTTSIKSENQNDPSLSSKVSSYASDHVQPMERSTDSSPKGPSMTSEEKMEKLLQQQVKATLNDQVHVPKYMHQIQNEVGGDSEVEGVSKEHPPDADSSTVQQSSCMSSALPNEISVDATSFRQLQYVMEQLDIRTKLCIRDSLYRLARSAEQRHNFGNSNCSCKDDADKNGVLKTEELNKCTQFMDMETETNPIDRSIAHLLFHRPSDPSTSVSNDVLSHESHARIQSSITSQPEKPVCQGKVADGAHTKRQN
ncbi:PREDICTED: protein LNK1-like isoform X2 [Nelumbo nucifera]|uniref:Protein LNK1-like isoform X2 n=1 Tax=Nelumbo nucifera TaxID=4432 RepID=A0A1U8AXL8_NELNU|nr:PREDICTED: protein LNK1-like isoform X2 [Nelumbo nucifera]